MHKIATGVLVLALILGASACQKSDAAASAAPAVTIGISKFVSHPALDAVEKGIQDELAAQGVAATFDLQNANADSNSTASIAAKFKADKVAVAVGIATPSAQALVQAITDVPVVYAAVTDPVGAGLVASLTEGGANVTGISDMTPVKEQLAFLVKLVPSVKRIGMVYTGGEDNAVVLAKLAEAAAKELGLEFVSTAITNSSEVKSAAQTIVGNVDAFYVSTDNTVVSALAALSEVATANKKPVMSADPTSSKDIEVLASWGFDYYKMGKATGRMIAEILGGATTASIPTRFMTDIKDVAVLVNLDSAAKLGITVPAEVVEAASMVIQNGVLTEK